MADQTSVTRRTALHDRHVAAGAKTADFGGWDMPMEYAGGVLAEHENVRRRVGIFDVSHLGTLTVQGPGAAAYVDSCLTNSLDRIGPGRAQYTLCCDAVTGGVVDDLIVYVIDADDVLLVPNASNNAEVARRLTAGAPDGVSVVDLHEGVAVLAVQGPLCEQVLASAGLPYGHEYMSFVVGDRRGVRVTVCRTGYTGEAGYELLTPAEDARELWDVLNAAATSLGGGACGLGARDTLRTEMGYPLHGHELSLDITPVQAGVGWAVGWRKPAFWGRETLLAEREAGPARRARGLLALGRGVPRAEMDVVTADGRPVGRTTSGTFSPTLGAGIALALLAPEVQPGDEVDVLVRGRPLRCRVVKPPFVTPAPVEPV